MKALVLILFIILMSGCTTYSIQKGVDANGNLYTKVDVKSTRDLEQPELSYSRSSEAGHASFDFKAAGVDNNTDAFMGLFSNMMGMMNSMMQQQQMLINSSQ